MNEKEMFLKMWEHEFATTLKILKQLPADKADFKPTAEKTKTAKALAEMFVGELGVCDGVLNGEVKLGGGTPTFPTYADVLTAYENTQRAMLDRVREMSDTDWNSTMTFPVGPKKMGEVRKGDIFWLMLKDGIHHRGQFSIYLRLVGAKVPSIYGPSADEPWM